MRLAVDLFAKADEHERSDLLRVARENDLLPYFRRLEGPSQPIVRMEGRDRIMLGGNNYLGLTGDRRVKDAAHEALEYYGTGLTGSRIMNGTLPLHLELEREIADWLQTEDALVFSTGYLANVGCIATLAGGSDSVVCDSGNHASIFDAVSMSNARLRPFRHGRLDKLELALERAASAGGGALVVTDGVFSMEGDIADVPAVADICRAFGARLMVDEAHGLGVLGASGTGATGAYEAEDQVDLRMGTFSKSLASSGGFIAGSAAVIDLLRVRSRSFLFTASAVPAAVAAALAALRIIRSEEGRLLSEKVMSNAAYLHAGLSELGFETCEPTLLPSGDEVLTPIVPVFVGDDWRATLMWKALYDAGVYVNVAIHPAVPRGGALLRTSVMATHDREHLDRALAAFEQVRGEVAASELSPPLS
jgi:8-amino-7-oxononanoate synthase